MLFLIENHYDLYTRAAMLQRDNTMKDESNVAEFDLSQLPVEASLILDIEPLASSIQIRLKEMLAPAPVGTYLQGQLEPVFGPGQAFFVIKDGQYVPIQSLDGVTSSVYNAKHQMVISSLYTKNQRTFLSQQPTLPYRGIQIVEGLFKQRLDQFVQWRRRGSNSFAWMEKHFDHTLHKSEVEEIGEYYIGEVSDLIGEWLGSYHWNLFFTKLKGSRLTIERCGDYRILDWMHRFEAGEIKL